MAGNKRTLRPLARFVLTRGLVLTALLLAGEMALRLKAGQGGVLAPRLREYAEVFRFAAATAFACALPGSLLVEDLLRYYGE